MNSPSSEVNRLRRTLSCDGKQGGKMGWCPIIGGDGNYSTKLLTHPCVGRVEVSSEMAFPFGFALLSLNKCIDRCPFADVLGSRLRIYLA